MQEGVKEHLRSGFAFINFKKTFGSINRECTYRVLHSEDILKKQAVIKVTYDAVKCYTQHRGKTSKKFETESEVDLIIATDCGAFQPLVNHANQVTVFRDHTQWQSKRRLHIVSKEKRTYRFHSIGRLLSQNPVLFLNHRFSYIPPYFAVRNFYVSKAWIHLIQAPSKRCSLTAL